MKNSLAGIIGQKETSIIGAVVDEITVKQSDMSLLNLMPVKSYPAHLVYVDYVTGFGGMLSERAVGAPGPTSSISSATTKEYSPAYFQESKLMTEKDLISLRRLGSMGDRGATGVTAGALDFLSRAAADLQVKLLNRFSKMVADSLFTGQFIYEGQVKASFGIPGGNTTTASSDWSIASSATPLSDLMTILKTNPLYYKYIIKELQLNPKTEAAILMSSEVRNVVINNATAAGDLNKVRQILYPGLPVFKVVKDAWQDQSVVGGQIVNGTASFFIPDFKVLAIPDFGGTLYGQYGEIQLTYNMNDPEASPEQPSMGVYTFVDEEGLKKRKAPYIEVTTGFNGGPALLRSNDVLVINGKSGI